jgi:hypothetical protein
MKTSTLHPDGTVTDGPSINPSRCPFFIWNPEHYRQDGSCMCDDPAHRKNVMRFWGYRAADFKRVGVVK